MKRESGLDLLRCLALLFVITFHSFLNNGYYYEPQTGFAMWLAGSFRWLSVACIGLFLMLSGFLKCEKTDLRNCYRGLIPVLLGYLIASAVSIPIRHFLFGEVLSFQTWCTYILSFYAVNYGWYVEMFLGLTLLVPFVNRLLKVLDDRGVLCLAALMLVLTACPGATPLPVLPDYWRVLYPLSYYILGAVVKRFQPRIHPLIGILGALGIAACLGTATVLSTDDFLNRALTWEFGDLWIVGIVLCLFLALYRLELPPWLGRILAFGADGCYGGYLLSYLLDAWCYRLIPQWRTPDHYGLMFLGVTVPIFLAAVLMGWILERVANRLAGRRKGSAKAKPFVSSETV
ncbi:MAG: acyltransferase family protein [Oscillospiraceae bacterium]|nr:acyltransferase family protein [Oscillospiraceae bacterium]